jgi:hypothetical protein
MRRSIPKGDMLLLCPHDYDWNEIKPSHSTAPNSAIYLYRDRSNSNLRIANTMDSSIEIVNAHWSQRIVTLSRIPIYVRPSSGPNIWAHMQKSPFCGRIHIAVRQRVPVFYTSTRVRGESCTRMASPSTHALTVGWLSESHMSKQELQHVREQDRGRHTASCPSVPRLPSRTLNPTIISSPVFRERFGQRPVLGVDAVFS